MLRSILLSSLALVSAGRGLAQDAPAAPAAELVDRVVAVVDEEPILLSDLERAIGLGHVERRAGESDLALRRRALDELIEWRLRLHEVARFGVDAAPLAEVDRQLERLRARFAGETEWRAELARLGLDEALVRQMLARQLAVLTYLEQRLGPRVFVGVEEIQAYYDDELAPRLRAEGEPVPPIEEVREAVRAVLREAKLNAEIDRWTRSLRLEADVIDLLEREAQPLPPAVVTFGERPPG